MKHFIFSLTLLFAGCEIPHTNYMGDIALCNIYNEEKNEIILCPQLHNVNISISNVKKDEVFLIRFLSNDFREAFEFQNNLLGNISDIYITENNTSLISFTPQITGTTILIIGDINLTLTIRDYFSF